MAMQLGMCVIRPPLMISSASGPCLFRGNTWRDADLPLCVVMSPTRSRLLDVAVEIATAQLRNGRHFVSITPTNSSLSHAASLKALRLVRGVHAAVADGCTFGCSLVPAGWQFVAALPQLAMRMQRRCVGCNVHVQRTPGQQLPARMRRAIGDEPTPNQRQAGKNSFCGNRCFDVSGEQGSGDIFGRPHSS